MKAGHSTSETRRTILIITSGQLSRNPRVPKEADALSRAGFDVTVLRVANVPEFERYDREMLTSAPYRSVAIELVRLGNLRRTFNADRLSTWAARHAARVGLELPHAFGAYGALLRTARQHPADLTIVHTETAFAVARDLIADGRLVAADFEDWHSHDLLPSAQAGRPLNLLEQLEREMMHKTAYVSATSHALSDALWAHFGGRHPIVVRNTFPLQAPAGQVPRNNPPRLFWFSQTVGPGRGLEEFVRAWALTTQRSRLVLLGDVTDSFREHLRALATPARADDLELLSPVAPSALPGLIARHDIGLALEHTQPPSRNLTITNKVFQYLNAGLAVLATSTSGQEEAASDAPEAIRFIQLGDDARLAGSIDALLAAPHQLRQMSAAARAAAETTLSWSRDEARLVSAVTEVLSRRSSTVPAQPDAPAP